MRNFLLLLAVLTCGWTGNAFAHAAFMGAIPEDGSYIESSPDELILRFNEQVSPISFALLDRSGADQGALEAPILRGTDLVLPLNAWLQDGAYLLSFRVTSADGHPIAGSVSFTVGDATAMEEAELESAETIDRSGVWLWPGRAINTLYTIALLLAIGYPLFALLLPGAAELARPLEQLPAVAGLATLLAVLNMGAEASAMMGYGFSGLFAANVWIESFRAGTGGAHLVAIAGLIVLVLSARRKGLAQAPLLIIGILLAALSKALTGHAQSQTPGWLLEPAILLHVLIAGFWFASLPSLLRIVGAGHPEASRAALDRFSRYAVAAVGALVLVGLVMSLVHLTHIDDLFDTGWGELLRNKLLFVALILLIAALNKWRYTPGVSAGDRGATRSLQRAIRIEIVVFVAIIAWSGVLAKTMPPKSEQMMNEELVEATPSGMAEGSEAPHAESVGQEVTIDIIEGPITVKLALSPGVAGKDNQLTLALTGEDGAEIKPVEAVISLSRPDLGVAPLSGRFETMDGTFVTNLSGIIIAGEWQAHLEVFVTDFDKVTFEFRVPFQ